MLYVFHVDTGTMMTFDMNLALESVSSLQTVIAKGCRISEDKQVLLISGGESLDPTATVGKYHAGTDTNPIFLFSKSTIEAATPPSPSVNYGSDIDLQGQVEGSLLMPPAYETVVSRAQLALQFHEVDAEELRACEQLIHDQHLQQQGWAAVVANLEDVTSELQARSNTFQESYTQYLSNRDSYRDILASITESLQLLSKIPVLSCLSRSNQGSGDDQTTLFDWISSQDTNHSLQDMVEQCVKATEQMDQNVGESLKVEVDVMFKDVHNPSMKEVKGLEDRLYGLDQIMSGARKIVQEQSDLAQGFVHNQNRVSNLQDRSILPDLCSSHKNQLVEMLKNHKRLRDIKKKCRMAKEELSVNLHTRLRWVMYVEKKICDVDGKLTIYHGNLQRLSKRLDILQQVHDAPRVYAQLVIEVVRRRQFSTKYLSWAKSLASDSGQLHNDEVRRREAFLLEMGRHFLQSLFQGFEDYPPMFATEAPADFDQNLPDITADDIDMLKQEVPELSEILNVPVDEDLFEDLHMVTKVSSVEWIEHAESETLHVPRTTSVTGSDIDIIHSEHHQLMSLDGGSISLGENLAECQQDTEIVVRPDPGPLSPADKPEFLLPKSLSEALTMEMKAEEKRKSGEFSDKTDGPVRESEDKAGPSQVAGETDKTPETESESQDTPPVTVAAGKPSKLKDKANRAVIFSDTSPDMETSQEFTTADFYIDESMPSSIADSPPNKASREDKRSPEQRLLAEKQQNERLQRELKDCELRETALQCKVKSLKDALEERLPLLREVVKDLNSFHTKDMNDFKAEFESTKENMLSIIAKYDSNLTSSNKALFDKLESDRSSSENELRDKIEQEMLKCKDLADQVRDMECEMVALKKTHVSELEKMVVERNELEAKLKGELVEVNKKHELELEVELDKLRAEYDELVKVAEKKLDEKESEFQLLNDKVEQAKKDRIKLEETLLEQHQKEKDEIMGIIETEYQEKLASALKLERDRFELEKGSAVQALTLQYEETTRQQLEELKSNLLHEKEKELEMTQSTLTLEHTKQTEEVKLRLEEEKAKELQKLLEDTELKYQEHLAKFSSEFNAEKEHLLVELQKYTRRSFSDSENQTECVCDMMDSFCQTDGESDLCESGFQTEAQELLSLSVQTEAGEQFHLSTQTDTLQQSHSTMQTSLTELEQLATQTDVTPQADTSIQTDCLQTGLQLETSNQDIQTERQETSHLGTQTSHSDQPQSVEQSSDQSADAVAVKQEYESKLLALQQQHEEEVSQLISRLEREKEDCTQLKSSLTSMMGDKQVKFNEAVNKVSQEKDRVIEEMKNKERDLVEQQKKDRAALEQLQGEKSKAEDIKERAMNLLQEKEREFSSSQRQLESDLALARQQAAQYQQQLQSVSETSVVSTSPSVVRISDPDEVDLLQRVRDLEDTIRLRDEELLKMQQKVMDLSMSASTRSLVQDKVSITSCHVGDLVLLCLDERLDQYVVFTVGTTLHFLHTDCLVVLGLKQSPSDARKQWLIAEVTDKEYCQAKKPNNRFKVPVGTKFYRVKAKAWTRETTGQTSRKTDQASASGVS